ncbi:MAG: EAL domain-containing protein, partial [Thermosynechococcaceae cyanobacterium]
ALLGQGVARGQVTLQAVQDAVITVDLEGEIQALNPVAERLTGWSIAEAQSQPLQTIFQAIDEVTRQPITNLLDGPLIAEQPRQQGLLLSRTGLEYLVEIAIAPIQDQDGNPLGTVLVLSDITESRQMKRDLSYYSTDEGLVQQRYERQWITRIHRALEEGRFCLYGQPIHPLTAPHPDIHCEVLLRLVESNGDLVLPMNFIPAAERYDLMPTIDRWVVKTFCQNYQAYRQTSHSQDVRYLYNINLSGSSINSPQFLTFLQDQLVQYQIPPKTICFEITETVAISDLDQAAEFIKALKQSGCSFALDDFGQGMSSLTYLKSLPVDYLKIDGGFIKQLVNSHTDAAIVDCFNHLSHELGIATIAECVENDVTLQRLQKMGVDYVQGFGIAMPQPLQFASAA